MPSAANISTTSIAQVYDELSAILKEKGINCAPSATAMRSTLSESRAPELLQPFEFTSVQLKLSGDEEFLLAIAAKVIAQHEFRVTDVADRTNPLREEIFKISLRHRRLDLGNEAIILSRQFGYKLRLGSAIKYLTRVLTPESGLIPPEIASLAAASIASPKSVSRDAKIRECYEVCFGVLSDLKIESFPILLMVREMLVRCGSHGRSKFHTIASMRKDFTNLKFSTRVELATAILDTAGKSLNINRCKSDLSRAEAIRIIAVADALALQLKVKLSIGEKGLFSESTFHRILGVKIPKVSEKNKRLVGGSASKKETLQAADGNTLSDSCKQLIIFQSDYSLCPKYRKENWSSLLQDLKTAGGLAWSRGKDSSYKMLEIGLNQTPASLRDSGLLLEKCNLVVDTLKRTGLADLAAVFEFEIPDPNFLRSERGSKAWSLLSPTLMVTACGLALFLHQFEINTILGSTSKLQSDITTLGNRFAADDLAEFQIKNPLLGILPIFVIMSRHNIITEAQRVSVQSAFSRSPAISIKQVELAQALLPTVQSSAILAGERGKKLTELAKVFTSFRALR